MKKLKTNQEIQIEIKRVACKINKDFNGQKIDLIALNDSPKLLINDHSKTFQIKAMNVLSLDLFTSKIGPKQPGKNYQRSGFSSLW